MHRSFGRSDAFDSGATGGFWSSNVQHGFAVDEIDLTNRSTGYVGDSRQIDGIGTSILNRSSGHIEGGRSTYLERIAAGSHNLSTLKIQFSIDGQEIVLGSLEVPCFRG